MPLKRKNSGSPAPSIREDSPDEYPKPLSLAATAEKVGWWPGVGGILLPKNPNASKLPDSGSAKEGKGKGGGKGEDEEETTLRVRTVKSMEREFEDNYADADVEEFGFCMMSGGTHRFLPALAAVENTECKVKKRKGSRYRATNYLKDNFPFAYWGEPYRFKGNGKPHLTEKLLGHDKKTGKPDVEISCTWSPTFIRNKVQRLLQSPDSKMTIAELCRQMEVSQDDYCKYMNKKSLESGPVPRFYIQAAYFFAKRDEGLVPIRSEKDSSRKAPSNDDDKENDKDGDEEDDEENGSSKKRRKTAKKSDESGKAVSKPRRKPNTRAAAKGVAR